MSYTSLLTCNRFFQSYVTIHINKQINDRFTIILQMVLNIPVKKTPTKPEPILLKKKKKKEDT